MILHFTNVLRFITEIYRHERRRLPPGHIERVILEKILELAAMKLNEAIFA